MVDRPGLCEIDNRHQGMLGRDTQRPAIFADGFDMPDF